MIESTTTYWQALLGDWPGNQSPAAPFQSSYPVRLPSGRVLVLPLRLLPGGTHAVASLIANQAAIAVVDALAHEMAGLVQGDRPDVVVGLPTLGLSFAPRVATGLGHDRYAPLGYSRKYWYDDALSEPINSITSPGGTKRLYLDPNLLPLLVGRRVCVVDDAVSTGSSLLAVYRLFARLGIEITVFVVAMKQTTRWILALAAVEPQLPAKVRGVFGCPLFERTPDGFVPVPGSLPEVP